MKKLLLTLDDDTAKELAKYPNRSETLREAFRMYNGHISTDTLAGMGISFTNLLKNQEELKMRFDASYEMIENMFNFLQEMRNR